MIVDIAMLILRVAVGAAAVVHGLQKLLGWWDGPGIDGFEDILLNPANPVHRFRRVRRPTGWRVWVRSPKPPPVRC